MIHISFKGVLARYSSAISLRDQHTLFSVISNIANNYNIDN